MTASKHVMQKYLESQKRLTDFKPEVTETRSKALC